MCISLNLFLMVISSQSLQKELHGHHARVEDVLERAGVIASIRSPEADSIRDGMEQLHHLWEVLWVETERRQLVLDAMYQAQQYYFDVGEVEAWLSEQELHMMNEETGKVGEENRAVVWGWETPDSHTGMMFLLLLKRSNIVQIKSYQIHK